MTTELSKEKLLKTLSSLEERIAFVEEGLEKTAIGMKYLFDFLIEAGIIEYVEEDNSGEE
jgi:hypothetical protein